MKLPRPATVKRSGIARRELGERESYWLTGTFVHLAPTVRQYRLPEGQVASDGCGRGGERRRYIASISTLDSGSHTLQSCRGPPVIYTATPQNLVISPEGSGGGRSVQAQSLSLVSCYRGFVSHGGIMNRSLSPRPSGTNPSPRFNRLDKRSASP